MHAPHGDAEEGHGARKRGKRKPGEPQNACDLLRRPDLALRENSYKRAMGTGLQKNSRIRVLIHHSFLAIRPLKENQSESGNGLPEPFGADSMAGLPFAAGAGEIPGVLSPGAPHSVQNALASGISEPHFEKYMSPPALDSRPDARHRGILPQGEGCFR